VDCPGHASLIRTIIGGAQIIDLMVLVIDATKGIQTQTAECLVRAAYIGGPHGITRELL
jgi:selenocysteine-specific elongation factor